MTHPFDSTQARSRRVFEQAGDEVDGVSGCAWAENLSCACQLGEKHPEKKGPYLGEGVRLDLRELVLHVIGVHCLDLLAGRSSEHFDNLDKLIDAALAREQGLTEHKLRHDTSRRPDVNIGRVVGSAKDKFRRSVVSGADIADVGFACDKYLGGTKVA